MIVHNAANETNHYNNSGVFLYGLKHIHISMENR